MNPAKVKEHFDRIGCFRVLVMGRSNAGKTTILQRVCNTTELPEVFDAKGEKVCHAPKHRVELAIDRNDQINPVIVQGSIEASQKCRLFINSTNYTQRGYHNIEDELIFQSNRGFVFHDSRGFEAGSKNEMDVVKDFVTDRATTILLEKRIHAIWWNCLTSF